VVEAIVGREELVADLAADLDEAPEPRVLIGVSGAGKSMVLVKLATQPRRGLAQAREAGVAASALIERATRRCSRIVSMPFSPG